MQNSDDDRQLDEAVHLVQKGFYVEPISYPIEFDKFPADGHEYIHRVRLEQAALFPGIQIDNVPDIVSQFASVMESEESDDDMPERPVNTTKKMKLPQWKRQEAIYFSDLALKLESMRNELIKKFPSKQFPPIENEKNVCLFCLGSELCKKVFPDEAVDDADGHSPLLSIVLHLSQEQILTVLGYISKWLRLIKMDHVVCRWLYALLACLLKPVPDEYEEFLEGFYDECAKKCKNADPLEKNQLHLVAVILREYFCVKAHTVGPSLESFSTMY